MPDLSKSFCVIGDPIEHSLSPEIHHHVFKFLKADFEYTKNHIHPGELNDFVRDAKKNNRPGFNVTIPHKQTIIPFLDEIDTIARKIGAVNTVHLKNGRLKGYNTDIFGFQLGLENAGYRIIPESGAVVIGAGGASRAVIAGLDRMGIQAVHLFDIMHERAEDVAADMSDAVQCNIVVGDMENRLLSSLKTADLIVNATPVGMWPKTDTMPVPAAFKVKQGCILFDLIPKPVDTKFIKEAQAKGAKTIPGLTMLIGQALAADEIWMDYKFSKTAFNEIVEELTQKLGQTN